MHARNDNASPGIGLINYLSAAFANCYVGVVENGETISHDYFMKAIQKNTSPRVGIFRVSRVKFVSEHF